MTLMHASMEELLGALFWFLMILKIRNIEGKREVCNCVEFNVCVGERRERSFIRVWRNQILRYDQVD